MSGANKTKPTIAEMNTGFLLDNNFFLNATIKNIKIMGTKTLAVLKV